MGSAEASASLPISPFCIQCIARCRRDDLRAGLGLAPMPMVVAVPLLSNREQRRLKARNAKQVHEFNAAD